MFHINQNRTILIISTTSATFPSDIGFNPHTINATLLPYTFNLVNYFGNIITYFEMVFIFLDPAVSPVNINVFHNLKFFSMKSLSILLAFANCQSSLSKI